ncbi:MAG: hypothetical protein AAGA75_26655, partial [Cyanobacteria bacterium P01_E01_bin.6]
MNELISALIGGVIGSISSEGRFAYFNRLGTLQQRSIAPFNYYFFSTLPDPLPQSSNLVSPKAE